MCRSAVLVLLVSTLGWGGDDYFTQWLSGPVKLIMTKDEEAAFKKLQTPEAKLTFKRIFWDRRDPNPDTVVNEYKQEFDKRVEYANATYTSGGIPGWQAPMGQIYVIFGPPVRTEKRITNGRKEFLWWYGKLKIPVLEPNEAFAFTELHNDGRMYLLPPAPDFGSSVDRAQAEAEVRAASQYMLPYKYDLASNVMNERKVAHPELNYDELLLTGKVTTEYQVKMIAFTWNASFSAGSAGRTRVDLTIGLPLKEISFENLEGGKARATLGVTASLLSAKGEQVAAAEDKITLEKTAAELNADTDAVQQKKLSTEVPPGTYRLQIVVEDTLTGRVGLIEQDLSVPASAP